MKQLILILFFIVLAPITHAKILRVNNNSGINVNYTGLQAAVDAATDNDTIHIEGSVTPYTGDVNIAKKVIIIGPGYFLSTTSETQYNKESAKLSGTITFSSGSEGSLLAGIEHNTGANGYQVDPNTSYSGDLLVVNADNIRIISCKLFNLQIKSDKNLSDISIQRCFFNPGLIRVTGGIAYTVNNLTISNCFFRNDHSNWTILQSNTLSSNWRLSNNTFYSRFRITNLLNAQVVGNVFYSISSGTGVLSQDVSNTYNNNVMNIAIGGMSDGVNGNSVRTEVENSWFSRANNDLTKDIYYTSASKTTSCPLRDQANPADDTKERGMYGGGSAYIPSGMFKIPSVYDIQMDNEVGDQFDMTIRARVH